MTASQITQLPALEPLTWTWRDRQIQYVAVGEGRPLVLVHGFGASIGHWRKNIPALAAAGYRVFAIDLLGFGGSDKPAIDYNLELWQALLEDFWQDRIGEPTVFVGNSIGALLCLMVAARRPDIVAGGVLLNCAGGLNHRPDELNLPLRVVMGTFARLVNSQLLGSFLFNRIRQKHRIRGTLKQVYRNRDAITDELVELLYQPSCDPGAQKVFASILSAPPGPRIEELLPHVQAPLLVLWGEDDPWTPVTGGRIFEQMAQSQPIEFVSIPKTGHCPHDERPDVVNARISQWLSKLE